jgi:hypothetical protein
MENLINKSELLALFEGNAAEVARVLEITRIAVNKWPDVLSRGISDRIIGAMTRKGLKVPKEWLRAE